MEPILQRAVMSLVNRIENGIRTNVASRSFWKEFGFPLPDVRRDLQRRAQAIVAASRTLEAGSTSGTVGDLFRRSVGGDPEVLGGPTGADESTIFARVPYYDPKKEYGPDDEPESWKSVSINVPWDTPLWEIYSLVAAEAGDMAEEYGSGEPDLTDIAYTIY